MDYLLAFSAAFGLSFLGMLPPGMLNMTVVSLSIKKSMRLALVFAFGAALIEFFQTWVMVKCVDAGQDFLDGNIYVYWVAFFILFGLGISYLVIKPKKIEEKKNVDSSPLKALIHGMSLSIVNVVAYVFWLMTGVYFINQGVLYSNTFILLAFSFGAMAGAFVVYLIYGILGDKLLSRFDFFANNINKIIALIFFFLSGLQLFKIFG